MDFILACNRRFPGFLKNRRVDTIIADNDGNCNEINPLFFKAGVTGIYPMVA